MSLNFTKQQRDVLRTFAEAVSGSAIHDVSARIIGIEDLANPAKAEALLNSLRAEDWRAASTHQAIAGTNNLLLAILLRVQAEGNVALDYWVAMRSPFELLDSSEIVAYGKPHGPLPGEMPLEKVYGF
jgi:hypothetical protein